MSKTEQRPSRTLVIARNSGWYAVDTVLSVATSLFTSIAIARVLGPERVSSFLFLSWVTGITGAVGMLGVPAACRKYMAEYFGRDELGLMRAVFHFGLRLQLYAAFFLSAAGVGLSLLWETPELRLTSIILSLSMFPSMVRSMPSQANVAQERMIANIPGSALSALVYVAGVTFSLRYGGGIVGLALVTLASKSTDLVARIIPVLRAMRRLPVVDAPPELRRNLWRFSGSSLVLLLLNLVVWDRSEFFFLKALCPDVRQLTFYSLSFNLTEKVLLFPQVLSGAVGSSVMVEAGRDRARLGAMVGTSLRYLLLVSLPLYCGLAALAWPTVAVTYGPQYASVPPVLVIGSLLAIPRTVLMPAYDVLQSTGRLRPMIRWQLACAVLDVALGVTLIPAFGSVGAALTNGIAQSVAVAGLWLVAVREVGIPVPWRFIGRLSAATALMSLVAAAMAFLLPRGAALFLGVPVGAAVFFAALKILRVLEPQDRSRLTTIVSKLPRALRPYAQRFVTSLISPGPPAPAASSG